MFRKSIKYWWEKRNINLKNLLNIDLKILIISQNLVLSRVPNSFWNFFQTRIFQKRWLWSTILRKFSPTIQDRGKVLYHVEDDDQSPIRSVSLEIIADVVIRHKSRFKKLHTNSEIYVSYHLTQVRITSSAVIICRNLT